MALYYVNNNAQSSGDHEVHVSGCVWLAKAHSTKYLGDFASCYGAVAEAKKYYSTADGCATCCSACNHG